MRTKQIGTVFVGLLSYDEMGVRDWTSWVDCGASGLVWGGVCETFLGAKFDASRVAAIRHTLHSNPKALIDWDGRFCAVDWDEAKECVIVTTPVTQSPSLWKTSGPNGWALGSRAAPLLELTAARKEPDLNSMNVFVAFYGPTHNESFFKGVDRVRHRHQFIVSSGEDVKQTCYVDLDECLDVHSDNTARSYAEWVQLGADRLTSRVKRQIDFSIDPLVLLTGGKDSRCIAAAAKRAGFKGPLHTGGLPTSFDVRLSRDIAERLGVMWQHDVGKADSPYEAMAAAPERVALWAGMAEGLETMMHALTFAAFFSKAPSQCIPEERRPLFHGLGGELARGYHYHATKWRGNDIPPEILNGHDFSAAHRRILARNAAEWTLSGPRAEQLLNPLFAQLDSDIPKCATVAQWLDLHYWLVDGLRWGEDMMSVKSPLYWHWTPLQDLHLIRIYWNLQFDKKNTDAYSKDMAVALAPELKGQPYDADIKPRKSMYYRITRRLARRFGLSTERLTGANRKQADAHLMQFWEQTFFSKRDHIWPKFISENQLRDIIRKAPESRVLWKLATVELVALTHF